MINVCLTNGKILMYAKRYMVETYILQNQSDTIAWLAQMQRQLQ